MSLLGNGFANGARIKVTIDGGQPRTLVDLFSDSVSVLNYRTNGKTFDRWLQDAIDDQYAKNPTGSAIFVPPGVYDFKMTEGTVIVPSNMTIWGIPGTAKLVPDLTTLATAASFTFPQTTRSMIGAGNPTTRARAGITSAGSVDPTTIEKNIHIIGLNFDNSAYFNAGRVQLSAGKFLTGCELFFSHNSSIQNNYAYGMPNSGLNFGAGHRNCRMINNHVEYNGYLCSEFGTRNGISTTGWIDATSQAMSSIAMNISGNQSNYNWQEGIQHSSTCGGVITNNRCIGNKEFGIEGENTNSDGSKRGSVIGYELPAEAIVANNYIDCYDEFENTFGTAAIKWDSSNEGNIKIIGNTCRRFDNSAGISPAGTGSSPYYALTSGGGITCFQQNDGVVTIENNTIEMGTAGSSSAAIACGARTLKVNGNTINNCSTTRSAINVFIANGADSIDLGKNTVNGGVLRYADITVSAGSVSTANIRNINLNGAICDSTADSFCVIRLPFNCSIDRVTFDEIEAQNINTSGNSSNAFIRFTGGLGGGFTTTITDFTMDNTVVGASGATPQPIIFDATTTINDNCIVNLHANGSRFKNFTNVQLVNTPAKVTNLFSTRNGWPGMPRNVIRTAAGNVTMTDEDDVVVINKTVPQATTVTLPGFCTVGKSHTIVDGAGNAATNNITINLAGGGTYTTINTNNGVITLIPLNRAGSTWVTI